MPDGTVFAAAGAVECCCDSGTVLMPVAQARARLLRETAPVAGTETLTLAKAAGRIAAAPALAATALPRFDQSAMDGYGLTAADLAPGAAPPRLVRRIAAGDAPGRALRPGEAVRLLTGVPVSDGVAAVVMEEHAALRDGRVC
jgi:molybdopterin molybdotransferase